MKEGGSLAAFFRLLTYLMVSGAISRSIFCI